MPTQRDDEVAPSALNGSAAYATPSSDQGGIHVGTVNSKLAQFIQGNITIHFHDYAALADGVRGKLSDGTHAFMQVIADELRGGDGNPTAFSQTLDTLAPAAEPPERMSYTDETILAWYRDQLSDRDRCLVRAAAILHGAPVYVVYNAAETLYNATSEHPAAYLEQSTSERQNQFDHLFLRTVVRDGTRRVYWRDADRHGTSAFGSRLLRLLASEIEGTGGSPSTRLLQRIEDWATQDVDSELSWRASRSLGAMWWLLDQARLGVMARQWAFSQSLQEQRRVAGLLFGSYEIERYSRSSAKGQRIFTLRLLRDLGDVARRELAGGYAIARTYALLGRRWPKVALDGLNHLLGLTSNTATPGGQEVLEGIAAPATQAYLRLANYGAVRFIIHDLASPVEALTTLYLQGDRTLGEQAATDQYQMALATTYFLFFLLTASSITSADPERHASGDVRATLGMKVAIPDSRGRDTLLAALVAEGEVALHAALRTLFVGAFLTGRAELAGEALRRWASELSVETTPKEHTEAYIDFMYHLGCELARLDREYGLQGFAASRVALELQLNSWPPWTPAGNLAMRVRQELGYAAV